MIKHFVSQAPPLHSPVVVMVGNALAPLFSLQESGNYPSKIQTQSAQLHPLSFASSVDEPKGSCRSFSIFESQYSMP